MPFLAVPFWLGGFGALLLKRLVPYSNLSTGGPSRVGFKNLSLMQTCFFSPRGLSKWKHWFFEGTRFLRGARASSWGGNRLIWLGLVLESGGNNDFGRTQKQFVCPETDQSNSVNGCGGIDASEGPLSVQTGGFFG